MYDRSNDIPTPIRHLSDQDIASLKKRAKRIKKDQPDLKHNQAIDLIAKQEGYSDWRSLLRANDPLYICEQLFSGTVAMLYDVKDFDGFENAARDEPWWQSSDQYTMWLMPKLFKEYLANPQDDPDREDDGPMSYDEFCEHMMLCSVLPATLISNDQEIDEFMLTVTERSFFPPDYVIYKGALIDVFSHSGAELTRRLRRLFGFHES